MLTRYFERRLNISIMHTHDTVKRTFYIKKIAYISTTLMYLDNTCNVINLKSVYINENKAIKIVIQVRLQHFITIL